MPKTDLSKEVKIEEGKGKSIFFITLILVIGVVIILIYSIAHGTDKFLSILSISAIIALTSELQPPKIQKISEPILISKKFQTGLQK